MQFFSGKSKILYLSVQEDQWLNLIDTYSKSHKTINVRTVGAI